MTENKRFQYNVNKNTIEQNGKFVAYMNSVDGARITNKLNELAEENEQLKLYIGEMEDYLARLEEKNEQLKADKQSLIDFIKKEFPKSHKHILEGFE